MNKLARRAFLLSSGSALGFGAARVLTSKTPVLDGVNSIVQLNDGSVLNDASGLSATPVHKHIMLTQDPGADLIDTVRTQMRSAQQEGRPFNIGAARHSMGGHAIPRDGYAVTFDNGWVDPDTDAQTYRVHAGTRWSEVISKLDPIGFSPKVMQSNNDFGVAATYSVNAHGWPVPFGPMGASVRALRMILPSGDLVSCSRTENPEIFGHAMGGYGLIGAILDLDVEMVRNTRLVPQFDVMPAGAFSSAFARILNDPTVSMAYGRLNVRRASFLNEALLISYRETPDQEALEPASGSGWMSHIARMIYRAQLGNEAMKDFRWWNETTLGPRMGGGAVTRNSLINEPVITLDDGDPNRTDILHEYFVALDRFDEFLEACRAVIPASFQEFLNVTLRYVGTDAHSTLSYAPVPRIAAVMSFTQEMSHRGEADMARMTQALIDRTGAIGGSYYLPYRPHARLDQFTAIYPRAAEFAAAKRAIDPKLVLRNTFWDTYLSTL